MNDQRNFSKLILALFACAALAACGTNSAYNLPPVSTNQLPQTGKPLPPLSTAEADKLTWRLVNGQTKRVSDYRGKAVILDFWATYCPPCEEGIPHFVELSNKYQNELQVVGLNVGGMDDRPNVPEFVRKYRMTYDLGYPDEKLQEFYLQGDTRIPQTLVFDRSGNLIEKFVGFTPDIQRRIDAAVRQALQ